LTAHIVIVDDEELLRNRLASCLLSEGYRVTAVDSAAAMREIVRRERIDLAVVDLAMPGENGLSLTRFLREQADIGIVILTARATRSIARSVSRWARTTTSPSRSTCASCSPGSGAC
jgi:DNA-binding response OmpR family regulator